MIGTLLNGYARLVSLILDVLSMSVYYGLMVDHVRYIFVEPCLSLARNSYVEHMSFLCLVTAGGNYLTYVLSINSTILRY